MTRAYLGLGSNLGDRLAAMQTAVQALARHPDISVVAVSGLYETDPVGGPEQGAFLNAVVAIDTELTAHALLRVAHEIEDAALRVRDVRWGPRTLDIDVLAFDDLTSSDDTLTLPHPLAHQRAFVLTPWADVDGGAALQGRTVNEWLEIVDASGVSRYAREWVQP
jgi:2-amino-4-hydroxy-6-hydroxymethyldihydropteridine diphosphokinase